MEQRTDDSSVEVDIFARNIVSCFDTLVQEGCVPEPLVSEG